jgi:integrase
MPNHSLNQQLTLADIKERISRDGTLSQARRADMSSALNRLAEVLGDPTGNIPAATTDLRRRMRVHGPAKEGIGPQRWRNIKSLVLAALRHCNVSRSYKVALSPEWQELFDRLPDRYARTALSRFMRYCSAQGVAPANTAQQHFDGFLTHLTDETLIKNPRVHHQTTCRVWNTIGDLVAGFSCHQVPVPRYRQTYGVSWEQCHPELVAGIRNYLAVLAHADPVGEGPTNPLRPSSRYAIEGNLKRYLGGLVAAGEDIANIRSLEELVNFERFAKAIRQLHHRFSQSQGITGPSTTDAKYDSLGRIAWNVRCIAVKHLACDEKTATKFDQVCRKFMVRRTRLSAKNDRLLVQFDDKFTIRRFSRTARSLWPARIPDDRRRISRAMALRVQTAVAVEILSRAPMRAENLVNLDFARHLRWQGKTLHIEIPEHEVKNRERLQYVLSPDRAKRVQLYVEHFRPVLMRGNNTHLFPGRKGRAKDKSCLCRQITRAMFESTGLHITPHQFRHITAKQYLDRYPGGYEVVRRVLGHKSTSTTYQHYAGRETKAAAECFDEVMTSIEKEHSVDTSRSSLRRKLLQQRRQVQPVFPSPKGKFRK